MNRLLASVAEDRWGRGRPNGRAVPAIVWLGFILFPLVNSITTTDRPSGRVLVVTGAVVFTVAYVWLVLIMFRPGVAAVRWALLAAQLVVAIVLTLHSPGHWGFMFTYCAACAVLVVPAGRGIPGILGLTTLAVVSTSIADGSEGVVISSGTTTIAIGLLMVLMRDLRDRNNELCEARAELARTAVAAERERFARDLHDLLGHSLSVITIKAELAGRLLPDDPARSGREIAEVEQVARQALAEVRQAVSGYRRPTLDGELEGARMALSAAGIAAEFDRAPTPLDPEVEAVLAWTVREGATNEFATAGRAAVR
ncbi:MAG TPA: histidine kinase [Solirubrobacteraceae bacterium]|nr:histidine kinase [Solirubrobacteraceae bacterium]